MSPSDATVCVVDDDPAVRCALSRLLRSAGFDVRSYGSPQHYLEEVRAKEPGCLVLDVAMPGLNGIELQQALAASGYEPAIVFLTGQGDIPTSVRAMKAGAIDFLMKPVDDEQLLAAVRFAVERDRHNRRARGEQVAILQHLASLTCREREVLEHVVRGQLNKQIAADLGTAEKTIKVHRARMMAKMAVGSVAELVRVAGHAGIPTGREPMPV